MSNKLFTLEKRIEYFLNRYPATRDDDMLLCGLYYDSYYGTSNLVYLAGKGVPPYESISRCRRKIQARGEYLPSEEASAFRKAHYKEVLDYVRNENTEEDEKSL